MDRNFARGAALLGAAGFAVLAAPAGAKAPVNEWFCKVLKAPFDPATAIKAFPLEKLPDPVENRRTKGEGEDKINYVELTAAGENYEVEYRYAYQEDEVSRPYGFHLSVRRETFDDTKAETAQKWLREFGKPVETMMGHKVAAGPPLFKGGDQVFYFEATDLIGTYSANWFHSKDIQHAAALCK